MEICDAIDLERRSVAIDQLLARLKQGPWPRLRARLLGLVPNLFRGGGATLRQVCPSDSHPPHHPAWSVGVFFAPTKSCALRARPHNSDIDIALERRGDGGSRLLGEIPGMIRELSNLYKISDSQQIGLPCSPFEFYAPTSMAGDES